MGTVFGASLSPLEKEADLICMESEMMDYKIKSIQDIVSGQYERALMECEYITLKNGGTYDEYTDMVLEAAAENTQKQAGIIRTILNAIGQQISRFGDFIQRALGTNNSRLKDVPDDATGTVDGKSATIIDKLIQVGPNLFKQIKQKISEIEEAIKQRKELQIASISLAAVGLGVLVKGSKENQEAENAPEKTINKPTFLDYMNKWAEFQDEFKDINNHGSKVLDMLLAPVDAVKARAEHIAAEKNARDEVLEDDTDTSESVTTTVTSDVPGEPVMESESNYGLSAYDGLFMEASEDTPADIDAALAKKDWKTASVILYGLASHDKISDQDNKAYEAKIKKVRDEEHEKARQARQVASNNNQNANNDATPKSKTPKTTASGQNGKPTGENKPASEMPIYNSDGTKQQKPQSTKTGNAAKPASSGSKQPNLASGANASPQGEEYKNHTKAQTAKTTVDAKNSAIMRDEYKGGTGTASYAAQVGDQKPRKHAPGMEPNPVQPGENEPPKEKLTSAIKGKFTRMVNGIKKLATDDPEAAKKKAEEQMPELKKFEGTEAQQKEMQEIIDKVAADKEAAANEKPKSEFSKRPWYDKAIIFLQSLLEVTRAVINATGASMANAVKGFVSWVKDNTAKATGKGDDENGEQPAQQEGQGEGEAKPENASAPIDNVEGDTMTESPDLFGIGDEYKEMTEGPSMDELSAFEAAIVNL